VWRCDHCGCQLARFARSGDLVQRKACPGCGAEPDPDAAPSPFAAASFAAAPERKPKSAVAHGQAKHIGTPDGSWLVEGYTTTTVHLADGDPPAPEPADEDAPNPWLSPLRSAVEVALVAWGLRCSSTQQLELLPRELRQPTERLRRFSKPGWEQRLRDRAARLDTIGRPPDEPLGPWEHNDLPLLDEDLADYREALELESQLSTEGHRRTFLAARRLVDEIDRLRARFRWIPIEERLPEPVATQPCDCGLGCSKGELRMAQGRRYLVLCEGRRESEILLWADGQWWAWAETAVEQVTHWQPLPPGPNPDTAATPRNRPSKPPAAPAPTSDPPEQPAPPGGAEGSRVHPLEVVADGSGSRVCPQWILDLLHYCAALHCGDSWEAANPEACEALHRFGAAVAANYGFDEQALGYVHRRSAARLVRAVLSAHPVTAAALPGLKLEDVVDGWLHRRRGDQ
jgi:hypothetical protein